MFVIHYIRFVHCEAYGTPVYTHAFLVRLFSMWYQVCCDNSAICYCHFITVHCAYNSRACNIVYKYKEYMYNYIFITYIGRCVTSLMLYAYVRSWGPRVNEYSVRCFVASLTYIKYYAFFFSKMWMKWTQTGTVPSVRLFSCLNSITVGWILMKSDIG
jgi:hypothetical protein